MPLMTGSLSASPRRVGGGGFSSAARRLRKNGYGNAAEKMAFAAETERMQRPSGIGRAEDRVIGGEIQDRQAAALNQLRMQRLANGYRNGDSNYSSASRPASTPTPATATSVPAATSGPTDPNFTEDPFGDARRETLRAGEGERRAAMRAELDKVTGTPAGPGNAADMEKSYQSERAAAIKTARERSSTEGGYTTRGGVIDEMNKARRAAGQREFEVSGKDFAAGDTADKPATATSGMSPKERAADIASRAAAIRSGLAENRASNPRPDTAPVEEKTADNLSPEKKGDSPAGSLLPDPASAMRAALSGAVLTGKAVDYGRGLRDIGMKSFKDSNALDATRDRALRRVASLEKGVNKISSNISPRAIATYGDASVNAAETATAARLARDRVSGFITEDIANKASRTADRARATADNVEHFVQRVGQQGTVAGEKLNVARQVAGELTQEAKNAMALHNANAAKANGLNKFLRPLTKIPGAKFLLKHAPMIATATDIYNSTAPVVRQVMGENVEDQAAVKERSAEITSSLEDGWATKTLANSIYRAVPARFGGGGDTVGEAAALLKSFGDTRLRAQEAEGEAALEQRKARPGYYTALQRSRSQSKR